jgi:Ca-activated chloride channel family protein
MSFGAPLFLVGLLLVPVALWLYAGHLRRRRGQAARFANPALMPVVAPRRPGWRAHAPIAVYGIALTALLVGLARPQTTVAVPVEQATVMLATDVSGSMQAEDVRPDRLTAAREAAIGMVERLPDGVRAGLVAFNHQARTTQSPTAEHERVVERLRTLESSGGTATGDAITAALNSIRAATPPGGKRPPAAILLLSDGESTRGRDELTAAREAARQKIPVYTVALGTDQGTIQVERPGGQSGTYTQRVPPDRQAMRQIAQITKGKAFSTADAGELDEIYERLGSQVALKDEQREVTAAFAGGALLLLLIGGAMSLRWFGRLP